MELQPVGHDLGPQASVRRGGAGSARSWGAQPGGRRGGGARRYPAAEASRWGQTLRHHRRQRRDFGSSNRQNGSADGPLVQSSCPRILCPLSPASPLLSDNTQDPHSPISTPSWLRTLQTARPASCSKKIETIDKRKNYIYTQPEKSEGERPVLALLKPAEDQSAFNRCSARSRRKEEAERLRWYKVL